MNNWAGKITREVRAAVLTAGVQWMQDSVSAGPVHGVTGPPAAGGRTRLFAPPPPPPAPAPVS